MNRISIFADFSLTTFFKILMSLILTSILLLSLACNQPQKLKILIVTGGHDFEREPFFEIFKAIPEIEFTEAVQPQANALYASEEILQYDALVFYDMVQEITDAQKQAFLELLQRGKGIVFLHHSLASYQEWDEFKEIIGGRYHLKPAEGFGASNYQHDVEVPVQIVDQKNPITKGLTDFVIHDEIYGNFEVVPQVVPLLKTSHPQSTEIIGWAHRYRNSRVVYVQLGHDHYAYENPNYRQLVKQAIEWVRRE